MVVFSIMMAMKNVLIISRFIKRRNSRNYFHFRGYFKGHKIASIEIAQGEFVLGEDYVLSLGSVKVEGQTLKGKLLASRQL